LPAAALIVVAAVALVRLIVASRVPLNEDESYYWMWSRHLAFGYTDHPPAVAWLIALLSPLGRAPGLVRLPFVLCGAFAALALGRAAMLLSGSAAAGAAAAIAFTLIPQTKLAMGEALPDGPYVLCWAVALMLSAEALHAPRRTTMPLLGVALGGAILSRFFGWALIGGIVGCALFEPNRILWRRGLWLALLIAAVLYAPFIAWNAAHGWENFRFTLHDRQAIHAFSAGRAGNLSSARYLVWAVLFWAVAAATVLRQRLWLVAWTALPLPTALAAFAFFATVESYWLLGPFASLCASIGIAFARLPRPARRIVTALAMVPAAWTAASVAFLALPESAQAAILRGGGPGARNALFSASFLYAPLARDVGALTQARGAVAASDRLEIASELTYNGVAAMLAGASPQVPQWNRWHDVRGAREGPPERVLLVTYDAPDPQLSGEIRRAYASVTEGPTLAYRHAGVPWGAFRTLWCASPRSSAARELYRLPATTSGGER
jgi:4-amino-4-deoxy-L-arabinose transferase-like glycosyltransferase